MSEIWVTIVEFAKLTGIDRCSASRLACRIASGRSTHWRGHALEVRVIHGPGGKSGKSYVVKVSTLPPEMQQRWKALQTPVEGRSKPVSGSAGMRERTWWLHVLEPALETEKGSRERKDALAAIASAKHLDWHDRKIRISLRTLQRKLARLEKTNSQGALARSGRADRGSKRAIVSVAWDKAVPFDDAVKERIGSELTLEIQGLVKGGMARGLVRFEASRTLTKLTRAEGFGLADPESLDGICSVPRHLVDAQWHYRKVHQFKRDRKAFEDGKPRISRSGAGMRPMELVVADVHPVDVHLFRDDGSTATVRFVAFTDWATQRARGRLVLLEKGGGIGNVDVIEAFADMVEDPAWGIPESFYVDNGKEYLFADLLGDAMQLTVQGFHGASRSCQIVHARPHNPSAKPIERFFGDLEQRYLSALPGWIGGDRMNKKREAVGRTVAPFGTFEAFAPWFYGMLGTYHAIPMDKKSILKGLSPHQAFAKHAGWQSVTMGRDEVRAACAKTETRKVRGGAISVSGKVFTCRELQAWMHDEVLVRVPAYHDPFELLVLRLDGKVLCVAQLDKDYHPLDQQGAREASRRQAVQRQAVRDLDRSAPTIDVAGRLIVIGNEAAVPVPNAPAGTISYDATPRNAKRKAAESERKAAQQEADRQVLLEAMFNKKRAG